MASGQVPAVRWGKHVKQLPPAKATKPSQVRELMAAAVLTFPSWEGARVVQRNHRLQALVDDCVGGRRSGKWSTRMMVETSLNNFLAKAEVARALHEAWQRFHSIGAGKIQFPLQASSAIDHGHQSADDTGAPASPQTSASSPDDHESVNVDDLELVEAARQIERQLSSEQQGQPANALDLMMDAARQQGRKAADVPKEERNIAQRLETYINEQVECLRKKGPDIHRHLRASGLWVRLLLLDNTMMSPSHRCVDRFTPCPTSLPLFPMSLLRFYPASTSMWANGLGWSLSSMVARAVMGRPRATASMFASLRIQTVCLLFLASAGLATSMVATHC
jgi:hypothetical protein